MIGEVDELAEQPHEIVEQGDQLGDYVEQVEYPTQEEDEQSQPLRRSERKRVESSKYSSLEYVLINDEGS
ncbi:hypothetical protein BC332_10421 [Capsicum chinense]|nr:hypothetical protein BC332_10421 [Capsicum chinense]